MPSIEAGESGAAIDRPGTDLVSRLQAEDAGISRNQLVSFMLDEMLDSLERFEREGFDGYRDEWLELDLLQGKRIVLEHKGQPLSGVAQGVDTKLRLAILFRDPARDLKRREPAPVDA